MTEQLSDYDKYRLGRLPLCSEQDQLSAHFSMKSSLPDRSDRVELVSNRSIPNKIQQTQSLRRELLQERRKGEELNMQCQQWKEKYQQLLARHSETEKELQKERQQKEMLKKTLDERQQKEQFTKSKLKQWVSQARHNLQ